MVRAVHSKTYSIFVVLLAIYCITIEEAYCSHGETHNSTSEGQGNHTETFYDASEHETESEPAHAATESASDHETESANEGGSMTANQGSMSANEGGSTPVFQYKSANTVACIEQIIEDLDCETAENCAIKMFNEQIYNKLQYYSKKFVKYIYKVMVRGQFFSLYSPLELCKTQINEEIKQGHVIYSKCTSGFWSSYTSLAVEHLFFWTRVKPLADEDDYGHYVRNRLTNDNSDLKRAHSVPIFCQETCISQIKIAFKGYTNTTQCASYAFKYLVLKDLMKFAWAYARYLSQFIKLKEHRRSDTPDWFCELFRGQSRNSDVKMTENEISQRIKVCKFDLDQAQLTFVKKDETNINNNAEDANTAVNNNNGEDANTAVNNNNGEDANTAVNNNNGEDANTSNGANNNPEDANTADNNNNGEDANTAVNNNIGEDANTAVNNNIGEDANTAVNNNNGEAMNNNNGEDANTTNDNEDDEDDTSYSLYHNHDNHQGIPELVDIDFVRHVFDNVSYTYLDETSDAYTYLDDILFDSVDFSEFQYAEVPTLFCSRMQNNIHIQNENQNTPSQ